MLEAFSFDIILLLNFAFITLPNGVGVPILVHPSFFPQGRRVNLCCPNLNALNYHATFQHSD